jgi:hypothetical protein
LHPYSCGDRDKHHILTNEFLKRYTYIGVAAGEDNLVWMDEVREVVKEFSLGPFAERLSSVATNTILKLISSGAGRCQTKQRL